MEPRLTRRQQEVLGFIRTFSQRHGVPPTVREIGERFGVTPRAAFDHLRALERKGYLRRRASTGRTSRALTLSDRSPMLREIPILGRIAAGLPLQSEENRDGALPVAAEWFGGKGDDMFSLRVHGESMVGAHIVEGDVVVVRHQDHAQPGDIVVALVDGEATVKRFARDGSAVVLKPEHPTMPPIVVRAGEHEVRILGKVVGLVRGA
ncbi:MAG TPA: transcriptional repressor LexA [Methylomirabilota bacterium]|jgi:repressor LexA|nr:transcriptional repressor LexA [Methylomirabilota bacterium]